MLISPPFLPARQNNQTEEAWLDAAFLPVDGEGMYPVGSNMCWHGGIHLRAPESAGQFLPVRAIADGTVVFVRSGEATRSDSPNHALNYDGNNNRAWTSDACVVIEHNTEIGADAQGNAVAVRFYSVYMHLTNIPNTIQPTRQINRKDSLGEAGFIRGEPNRIHFEIACDRENLERLIGRTTGDLPITQDGRSSVVFGELYFHLPVGTPVFAQKPLDNNPVAHIQPPRPSANAPLPPLQTLTSDTATASPLIVGMRYALGDGAVENRGDLTVSTYLEDGTRCGTALREERYEYNLYTRATEISNSYPATGRPAPSAILELLRFGRIVNTENETLTPNDVPHWRQINIPSADGTGTLQRWVNLNNLAAGQIVRKFSDADFPQWSGWRVFDDDLTAGDSRCESTAFKALLDIDRNGNVTPAERLARMQDAAVQTKAKRAICAMPSEWNAADIDARWSWLKTVTEENPGALDEKDFAGFSAHVRALCITTPALHAATYRFHPQEFVETFRKCHRLTESNLQRIYPDTPATVVSRYRSAVNQVLARYGMNTPCRSSHFFGQGLVETMGLRLMVEGSVSFARNPDHASFQSEENGYYQNPLDLYGYFHNYERVGNDLGNVDRSDLRDSQGNALPVVLGRDARDRPTVSSPTAQQIDAGRSRVGDGMKFRGRGFKQLTGRANYAAYWVFRGWLRSGVDFDEAWWQPPRRPTDRQRVPAPIDDPQRLSTNPFNCIDSGGQFACRNGIPRRADGGVTRADADNVSRIVNRWDEPSFPRRFNGTTAAYEILGP